MGKIEAIHEGQEEAEHAGHDRSWKRPWLPQRQKKKKDEPRPPPRRVTLETAALLLGVEDFASTNPEVTFWEGGDGETLGQETSRMFTQTKSHTETRALAAPHVGILRTELCLKNKTS